MSKHGIFQRLLIGKETNKNRRCFRAFLPADRKGMEMWMLVLIILGIILLLWGLMWFGGLGKTISRLLERLGGLF